MQHLPLYDFFDALRTRLGIELGIRDYLLLPEALEGGYDLVGDKQLLELCETLWLKSQTKQDSFRRLFRDFNDAQVREAIERWQREQQEKEERSAQRQSQDSGTTASEPKPEKPSGKDDKARGSEPDSPIPSTSETRSNQEVSISMEDSEAGLSLDTDSPGRSTSILKHKYILSDQYYPVSERELQQQWRFLRNKEIEGTSHNINLKKTIDDITEDGVLDSIHFDPTFTNRYDLVFLVDRGRDMVAFHRFGEMIVRTARTGSQLEHVKTYYFDAVPQARLFTRPDRTEAQDLEGALLGLDELHTKLVVFSDAGAATSRLDSDQLTTWWELLDRLKPRVVRLVWLNPMPAQRWAGTMAELIGSLVPMFETTPKGIAQAVKVLRGNVPGV